MSLSIFKKLGICEARPTTVTLQLAYRSFCYPQGKIEDVLVRVDKFVFPADFIIVDFTADEETPILLGRPFLAIGRTLIDVERGELTIRVNAQEVTFNVLKAMKYPNEENEDVSLLQSWDSLVYKQFDKSHDLLKKELTLVDSEEWFQEGLKGDSPPTAKLIDKYETLEMPPDSKKMNIPSVLKSLELELKQLPSPLKYAFLESKQQLPVIIAAELTTTQETSLISLLQKHKRVIAWQMTDIKGISPTISMHKILLEENSKNSVECQRRLNPIMKEVVKKEIIKWLDAGIIYPIFDSVRVSPVQCVPKRGGMTVVANDKNELVPTRAVTGWGICMDYKKLNKATRKDYFPLPFIDQMLDRLAGKGFYCFLGIFWI
jgi:hypothetical protein